MGHALQVCRVYRKGRAQIGPKELTEKVICFVDHMVGLL